MHIVTRVGRLAAAGVLSVVFAPVATAQTEWVYGPTGSLDQGARRVSAVSTACGGGFVSVGTSTAGGNSNVYVVRTTALGAPIWELQYDIGPGQNDRGESIVALAGGTGFVVAGSTTDAAGTDAFLMRLSCTGAIVWLNVYTSPTSEGAFDVIEARSGDAAFGTAVGDLVAAGFATNPAGSTDAMIFRVRSNGAMIWNRRYDVGGAREQFRALVEARPNPPALAGDIVVGGWIDPGTGTVQQGYVARVNGNNGAIGGGLQCAAHYGDASPQRFEAVTDIVATGALAGQFVFGGVASGPNTSNDIYLLRTQPNPCLPLQQRRIGDAASAVFGDETLAGLKEVTVATLPVAPLGSLALTGSVGTAATTAPDNDAALLIVSPTTLAPLGGSGRLYGDHAARYETGVSVFPHAAGFTITGWNDADPQAVGDLRDLYLINADVNGNTTCQAPWAPTHIVPPFPVATVTPTILPFMTQAPKTAAIVSVLTAFQSCP